MKQKMAIFPAVSILTLILIISCGCKSLETTTAQYTYPVEARGIPDPMDNDYFCITTGPDGNMWFIEGDENKIGKISPGDGAITEYNVPTFYARPSGIAAGSDGNLWFTEYDANKIGKISPQ